MAENTATVAASTETTPEPITPAAVMEGWAVGMAIRKMRG